MKCKKCKKEISDRDKYRTSWEKDGETWHECGKCSGTMSTEDALALALDALAKIDSWDWELVFENVQVDGEILDNLGHVSDVIKLIQERTVK